MLEISICFGYFKQNKGTRLNEVNPNRNMPCLHKPKRLHLEQPYSCQNSFFTFSLSLSLSFFILNVIKLVVAIMGVVASFFGFRFTRHSLPSFIVRFRVAYANRSRCVHSATFSLHRCVHPLRLFHHTYISLSIYLNLLLSLGEAKSGADTPSQCSSAHTKGRLLILVLSTSV